MKMTKTPSAVSARRRQILMLPPSENTGLPIDSLLKNEAFDLTLVSSVKDALNVLRRRQTDLVILNRSHLADPDLQAALQRQQLQTACLCFESDAADSTSPPEIVNNRLVTRYVSPLLPDQLVTTINDVLERQDLRRQILDLKETVAMHYGFDQLVGVSSSIRSLRQAARRVAPTEITVLLGGPAGSGKELLARIIHHHSARCCRPFVVVDCMALPEFLLQATLFGDESLAAQGMIPRAEGGTLFLKNVDALPISIQAGLGRFVRDLHLSGDPEGARRDVRFMASTTADLDLQVSLGQFDRGLCNGLKVVELNLPLLTERCEDIEMLVEHCLRRLAFDRGQGNYHITRAAVEKLRQYRWPGNVRELENCLQRAVAVCRERIIERGDVSFIGQTGRPEPVGADDYSVASGVGGSLDDGQREIIVRALDENNWNFTQTAQELGIGRTTLWRKVRKYRLSRESVMTGTK
ncbi:MAG: sigma 54-interacting transcriptional regulator [bacterium]